MFPAANGTRPYDDTLYAVPGTHGAGHAPCPRGRLSGYGNRRPETAPLLGANRTFAYGLQAELHARHPGIEKLDAGKRELPLRCRGVSVDVARLAGRILGGGGKRQYPLLLSQP